MQDSYLAKAGLYGKKKNRTMLFKNLHTGAWAGWFSKILYAIAALIGVFLSVCGYYMWWKRNLKDSMKDDSDFKNTESRLILYKTFI